MTDFDDGRIIPIRAGKLSVSGSETDIDQHVMAALGRHFKEVSSSRSSRNIELYSDDLQSIESERAFRARFGFSLGRRGRIALFDVMDTYDLTSEEVRSLYKAGLLSWDGQSLRVGGRRWIGLVGAVYLLGICALAAPFMLALFATEPNELLRRAALSAALAVLGGLSAFVYRQYLMPFQWLCCTNPVRDSSRESSVIAGTHEQTDTHDLQDQELAGLQ